MVSTAVVVLAAGAGTRMRSRTSKMLHPMCGRSLVGHVLHAAAELQPERIVVVVGHQRDQVGPHVSELAPGAELAVQETPSGTGDATRIALESLGESVPDTVVVLSGDTPLLEAETLAALLAEHRATGAAATLLTGVVANPTGYGRVVRDAGGNVVAVVEEKDATAEQRAVTEINSAVYVFDGKFLADAVARIGPENAQGEYYLPDAVALAVADGRAVSTYRLDDVRQTEGVNDRVQLADLAAEMNRRILRRWMRDGVTVVDPTTTWVDVGVSLAPDVILRPGVQLHGATVVEEGAEVGPDCTLTDVRVGAGARVVRTHGSQAVIGAEASVGPFAYLRPGAVLGEAGKIGTFVEVKNSTIAKGAKVPHLSYVGDAEIGEGSNIGAGTIFANYDGVAKHRTSVGERAKTGSNNTFVAPVEIGDGAMTGGGAVIRRNVPPGALAVSGGPQRNLEGWVETHRPGTPMAEAARRGEMGVADPEGSEGESPHAGDEEQ